MQLYLTGESGQTSTLETNQRKLLIWVWHLRYGKDCSIRDMHQQLFVRITLELWCFVEALCPCLLQNCCSGSPFRLIQSRDFVELYVLV